MSTAKTKLDIKPKVLEILSSTEASAIIAPICRKNSAQERDIEEKVISICKKNTLSDYEIEEKIKKISNNSSFVESMCKTMFTLNAITLESEKIATRDVKKQIETQLPNIIERNVNETMTKLTKKFQKKMPEIAKESPELIQQIATMVNNYVAEYIRDRFPTLVNPEIANQLQQFITNHPQLHEMRTHHFNELNIHLESTVKDIISRVVSEPQHNTIIHEYLKSATEKVEAQQEKMKRDSSAQLSAQRDEFYKIKSEMSNNSSAQRDEFHKIKSEISNEVQTQMKQVERMYATTIAQQQGELEKCREELKKINGILWTSVAGMVGLGAAVLYIYFNGNAVHLEGDIELI
uniref:Uncharacterized protein n=1 Tax=viral metagenome TaxID=1070528 RepID=A0A6C0C876_9ZZZZ